MAPAHPLPWGMHRANAQGSTIAVDRAAESSQRFGALSVLEIRVNNSPFPRKGPKEKMHVPGTS